MSRDGADICFSIDPTDAAGSLVKPLMAIRADRSGRLAVVGIGRDDVAAAVAPAAGISRKPTVIPIDRQRAVRLGATRAFSFFSLIVDRRTLCADEPPRVLGHDGSGRRLAKSRVPISTRLLDVADRVPYSRSLEALCGPPVSSEPGALRWLTEMGAVLRSLLRNLI